MSRAAGLVSLLALAAATPGVAWAAEAPKASAAVSVQELVVTAAVPQAQTQLDRKVYSVVTDLQATSGSAADVLNNVPSVAVDADGNVSLRGDGNVTILVDGKPSAQFSGPSKGLSLQQFSASDIDRVEVLTTPPSQYKAEGSGGVINIITKKTRKAGSSGGAQFSLGDQRRYVAALTGAYNSGPLKLSGGLGLRQDTRERLTTTERVVRDPVTGALVASQQSLDEHQHRITPSVKATADYALNARQSVSGSFSYREVSGTRYFNQHDLDGTDASAATAISDRHDDGKDWSADNGASLRFDQRLWRPNETLSLAVQHSGNHERESNAYRNSFTLPLAAATFDDLHISHDLVKTEFSADYDLPLSGGREIRLGYDLEDDRDAFDRFGGPLDPVTGLSTDSPVVTNHFRYRQTVNAGYGQYETALGPWNLQAGVRLEAARARFLQITGNIPGERRDSGVYPSLHLARAVGDDGKISLGLSRRLTRPDPEISNPFIDRQDTHNLRAGNPNLAPQDTWSYEAGYGGVALGQNFGLTAYARSDRNAVTDIVRPVSDDVVLATKTNLPKSRSAGLEMTANGKLGRTLSYSLSGDLFAAQIDATALGAAGLKSTTGLNLKSSLTWRPTRDDTAQISLTRQDKRLTPQGFVSAINLVNFGYRRQIGPELALVATVSDLFDGQKTQRIIRTPQLSDIYVRSQLGRIAYVGLVYTFGGAGKSKPDSFDYQS